MESGFELLYRKYYSQVYSFVMTLARNRDTAEEITQQAFVKALTSKKAFRGESSEITWLCSIAKNIFIDEQREQNKVDNMASVLESSVHLSAMEMELESENEEKIFQIHKALHSLNEPYKEVFHLRVFGDLSFENIGKLFGKTANWACVTYHRARLKIKEILEGK